MFAVFPPEEKSIVPPPHQIAVTLLDDIAQMNADAKDDAAFGWNARKTLHHGVLHSDGATHRVHHPAELNERAVARCV
jgi:hypothetical protein